MPVDALTAIVPAASTQVARFAERDELDLPAKADELERALRDEGFNPDRFGDVLAGMREVRADRSQRPGGTQVRGHTRNRESRPIGGRVAAPPGSAAAAAAAST